ncbi:MAG: hypothetical protein M0C28_20835 [Candidatus Moduliflexus flocculans]|nr:hypothetical protein [Candidatus Moduliflexus flocculans]
MTCEVCHGPGSAYRKLNIMQDRSEGASRTASSSTPTPAAIEAHCLKCHQNAHGVAFDFEDGLGRGQASRPREIGRDAMSEHSAARGAARACVLAAADLPSSGPAPRPRPIETCRPTTTPS